MHKALDAPSTTTAASPAAHSDAWYVVTMLAVIYIFSTVDRTIIALLAEQISTAMTLTDAQMGLIIGLGFAVLYALAGLPLAHWMDTRTRKVMITAGVIMWSGMTIASAFAQDFWTLLICRAGVAFGEAVLSPAAVSLIADLFPRGKRTLPMSIYSSIGGIFGSGAFFVGAAALQLATPLAQPFGLAPWQMTLILLGAPGILLALLFYVSVREPLRGNFEEAPEAADVRAFCGYLWRNIGFYGPLMLGAGLMAAFAYGVISWLPTILVRDHGYAVRDAGYVLGAVGIIAGAIGTLLLPQITARVERARPGYGVPATLTVLSLGMLPGMMLTPLSADVVVLVGGVFVTTICASCWGVTLPVGFQIYGPSRMRARLMACFLLATNLIGLSIGPMLVVYLTGLTGAPSLARGIAMTGWITWPLLLLCSLACYRAAKRMQLASE